MIEDFMTVEEAAQYLGCTKSAVCHICRQGGFEGARRAGQRVWLIPRQSVLSYRKGLQGFAAVQAKKKAEKASVLANINEAIITAQVQAKKKAEVKVIDTAETVSD